MPPHSDILIIGAGPSGLAVGACLARHGLPAQIFERGDTIGWSWAQRYEFLRLHTPRGFSDLPGLPLPASRYPDRNELLAYLHDYARQAGLEVECGREATALARENGAWRVETSRGPVRARQVVIASGFYAERRPEPNWPGREIFSGRWLKPTEVWRLTDWNGRRPLIVGLGNTAADVLALLHSRGARTAVSIRGAVHLAPRELLGANAFQWRRWVPERLLGLRRFGDKARRMAERTGALLWWLLQEHHYRDLRLRGLALKSVEEILRDHLAGHVPVIAGSWLNLLRNGEIPIFPAIATFTTEGAVFVDGRRESFTDIIPALGYSDRRFPLAGDVQAPMRDGPVPGRPGLWVCGANPGLYQIRPAARRVARAIAREMRR